jgi:hypothetical protein
MIVCCSLFLFRSVFKCTSVLLTDGGLEEDIRLKFFHIICPSFQICPLNCSRFSVVTMNTMH